MNLERIRSVLAGLMTITVSVAALSATPLLAQEVVDAAPPQLLDQSLTSVDGQFLDGQVIDGSSINGVSFSFSDAGGCMPWQYGHPALFYNFYAPNNCGANAAQLYIAPRPVPVHVGHTYYTYQPLMPHEFTYPHYRTYRRYYDGGRGLNRTKVTWHCNPVVEAVKGAAQVLTIPR
jgi:hypothetical protein